MQYKMEQISFKMKPRLFPNNDSIYQIHTHTLNCDNVLVVFQILL